MENEEELVKRAKNRETDAFGALYDQYQPAIYRFILLKTSRKSTAEDLTHQVFLKAWQNIENYQCRGWPFSSWLYRMAQNLIIDYYRTKKLHYNLDDCDEIAAAVDLEKEFDQKAELKIIKDCLRELPDKQQTIIIMKFVEGLTNREISVVLGKSETAVKIHQHRSMKNLKKLISEKYGKHFA